MRRLARFVARRKHCTAQAAVVGFHFGKARKYGAHAEFGSCSAINAGKQRVNEAIHDFRPVVPLHE